MRRGIVLHLGQKEIWFHESIVSSYLILILVTVASIYIGSRIKKADIRQRPKGLLHIVEVAVEGINGLTEQVMGKENLKFAPYMLTVGVFLVCANLSGLVGLTPPTSDYNVTLAMAAITFVAIHYFSLKAKGPGGYLKQYLEPLPILLPINILGEISAPISLSFRLFGNILSGALIMSLVYTGMAKLSSVLAPIVAWPLHGYFDVFSGLLQTFIFIMLSMSYIKAKLPD